MRALRLDALAALLLAASCSAPAPASQPLGGARLVVDEQLVTEAAVDFGATVVGERTEREVRAVNDGDATVQLFVAFQGAPFVFDGTTRVTLAPGERVRWPIAFTPELEGRYSGELLVSVTAGDVERLRVSLSGVAKARAIPASDPACLEVPAFVFPETVATCTPSTATARLRNTCDVPFGLTGMRLISPENVFSAKRRPSLPHELGAGESVELELAFAPTRAGVVEGTLELFSGARSSTVTLSAQAKEPTILRRDVFPPEPLPKADLLLVLDDSPSFASKRAHVEKQLRDVAAHLAPVGQDLRVAVTTTSVCRDPDACGADEAGIANGRFLPLDGSAPRILQPELPGFADQLAAFAGFIGRGNEQEHLLRPALLAASEPLRSGHNAGFPREDAYLAVVVISDAADHDETPVAELLEAFQEIKGVRRPYEASFSAIVPIPEHKRPACLYDDMMAAVSRRTSELVRATGGIWDDICGDWARSVVQPFRCTHCWYPAPLRLTRQPWNPDETLAVTQGGVPLPRRHPHWGEQWEYDPLRNEVRVAPILFEGSAERTVSYVACE